MNGMLDHQYEELRKLEEGRDGIAARMELSKAIVMLAQSAHWPPFVEAIAQARATTMKRMIQFGLGDEERKECAAEARCWQWILDRTKYAVRETPGMEQALAAANKELANLAKILPERG